MIVIKQGLVTVGKKQEIVMFLYPARIKKNDNRNRLLSALFVQIKVYT